MRFIGIDLAWTYKNETGICVMNEAGEIEYLDSAIFSDEEIVSGSFIVFSSMFIIREGVLWLDMPCRRRARVVYQNQG